VIDYIVFCPVQELLPQVIAIIDRWQLPSPSTTTQRGHYTRGDVLFISHSAIDSRHLLTGYHNQTFKKTIP
jgi:hypothetical protein